MGARRPRRHGRAARPGRRRGWRGRPAAPDHRLLRGAGGGMSAMTTSLAARPSLLLRGVGAFLVVFALFVAVLGTRVPLAVIGANIAWAAGSIVAAIAGWGSPETVGTVWIVLQAITVGALAELGLLGLR